MPFQIHIRTYLIFEWKNIFMLASCQGLNVVLLKTKYNSLKILSPNKQTLNVSMQQICLTTRLGMVHLWPLLSHDNCKGKLLISNLYNKFENITNFKIWFKL